MPEDNVDAELIRLIRQQKAEAAMRAISAGANPAEQAFHLANDFTDTVTGSILARVRRLFRRS